MELEDIPLSGPWTIGHIAAVERAICNEHDPKNKRVLNSFLARMVRRPEEIDARCRCKANFAAAAIDKSECPIHD